MLFGVVTVFGEETFVFSAIFLLVQRWITGNSGRNKGADTCTATSEEMFRRHRFVDIQRFQRNTRDEFARGKVHSKNRLPELSQSESHFSFFLG